MKISYDKGVDAMYITFQDGKCDISKEVDE